MKALFIGGTGTISTDVVELAQQRGVGEITLLNRGSKKTAGRCGQYHCRHSR